MRVKFAIFALAGLAVSVSAARGSGDDASATGAAWSRDLGGAITDLDVARRSGDALASTIYDIELGRGANRVFEFDSKGKQRWMLPLKATVRAQGIARDGSLAAVSTHEDELIAIDGKKGRVLWRTHGTCRPYVLVSSGKVLCWHDDDAEPEIGFEAFDFKGKRLFSFPISTDTLAFAVSPDESRFAISLTGKGTEGGEVAVFDSATLSPRWKAKVKGDVLKLAFAPGPKPLLAALSGGSKAKPNIQKEELALFNDDGKEVARVVPEHHAEQVEFAGSPSHVVLYSNGASGQELDCFEARGLKRSGGVAAPKSGNYYALPVGVPGHAEGAFLSAWQKQLALFSCSGTVMWSVPKVKEEGSFLYGIQAPAQEAQLIVAAFEDGILEAYSPVGKTKNPARRGKTSAGGERGSSLSHSKKKRAQ